jgi:hypothetical protein
MGQTPALAMRCGLDIPGPGAAPGAQAVAFAAIQGERRLRGCVFPGERVFCGGSGCGGVACDDTVSVSERVGPPRYLWRSPGRAVRVLGGTIAHGRQQSGCCGGASRQRPAFVSRVRGAAGRVGSRGPAAGLHGGAGSGERPAAAGAVRLVRVDACSSSGVAAGAAV